MSDNWDDAEVWKKVKGSNQVRQRSIGDALFLDVKTGGEVLRIRLSADGDWDDDIADLPSNESPVYFGDVEFGSEFYPAGEPVPVPPGQPTPPPSNFVRKVKMRTAGGGTSPWMTFTSENVGLMPYVVAVRIECEGMAGNKTVTPTLQSNEFITNAEVEGLGSPPVVPPNTTDWSGVQIACDTALMAP